MKLNRIQKAWILLVAALALHVLDEATSGFLPLYNQTVFDHRERLGFFPAPTFPFGLWLGGLMGIVIVGFAVTPLFREGGRITRVVTTVAGTLMVANGLGHTLGSIYVGYLLPGFWSSPVLLAAAAWLVYVSRQGRRGAERSR